MRASIVLAGLGPKLAGLKWEAEQSLRIGRLASVDVVLQDPSVERIHAEIKNSGARWIVRDLARNPHFPTLVNGALLSGGQQELRVKDVLQLGQLSLKVLTARTAHTNDAPLDVQELPGSSDVLPKTAGPAGAPEPAFGPRAGFHPAARMRGEFGEMEIQSITRQSWDQALEVVAKDCRPRNGQAMLTLLRANHHLCKLSRLEELLQSILKDALSALAAQRGAILLSEPGKDQLTLKARIASELEQQHKGYSRTLAERCFRNGESLMYQAVPTEDALEGAGSINQGAMASAICALLRTPRQRLGVLHLDRGPLQEPFTDRDLYLADAMAASVAIGIECAQAVEQQRDQFLETVTTLARTVELRDRHTADHTRRVTSYSLLLAEAMQLPQDQRYHLQIGTPLHDIGKIGIDDAILRKPGKLTAAEFDTMKTHTVKGAAIIETMGSLNSVVPIIRHHHERWDGNGYPDRLARDKIALTARIVAVADAFDAMTSDRPYRPAMPAPLVYLQMLSEAGTHFDPACVQALMSLRPQIENMLQQR